MSQAIQNDSNVSSQDNPNWVQLSSQEGGYGEYHLSSGDLVTLALKNPTVSYFYKNGIKLDVVVRSDNGELALKTVGVFSPGEKARIRSIWKHSGMGSVVAFIEKEDNTWGQIPFHFLAPAQ